MQKEKTENEDDYGMLGGGWNAWSGGVLFLAIHCRRLPSWQRELLKKY